LKTQRFSEGIEEARKGLIAHPLYDRLSTFDDAKLFMQYHVFAVWDFFSLLKRLQREVSCIDVPWLPRGMSSHARFIVEIALSEESDEAIGSGYTSHFELYLDAMSEIGADRSAIDSFRAGLTAGEDPFKALAEDHIPGFVCDFVSSTLSVALEGQPHEVAASFCHGRENLLPDVLTGIRDGLGSELKRAPVFRHYLDRHITLDHDEHGPLALKLLAELCGGDPVKNTEAERVGIQAIRARGQLWDGILSRLDSTVPA